MDTHYYSISLASGEHLGFLLAVVDKQEALSRSGEALIKLQASNDTDIQRPESLALQALSMHQPLIWQQQRNGSIILFDAEKQDLTHIQDGYFKWRNYLYLINDIASVM